MALSIPHPAARPQPIRITGLGIAITVNLAALLLMSLPQEFAEPPPASPKPEPFKTVWVKPEQPLPVLPVPPPPTVPVRNERITRPNVPAPAPVPMDNVEPSPMSFSVEPVPPSDMVGDPVDVTLVGDTGMRVGYLVTPQPPYPGPALKQGAEGTVVLRVLVGADGRPLRVEIERSSGHRTLDRSARDHVLGRWRFEPARSGGRTVEAWALIPIDYRIPY
jgi:periplasmic protein TonB